MFDTMTLTKAAAGLFGAWLVLLVGKWIGMEVYHVGGHGEQAYVIDTGEEDVADEPEVDFGEVLASADAGDGAKVFRKCSGCHAIPAGEVKQGPWLGGVVGRDIASVDYGFSGALGDLEGDWTPEALNAFLESPAGYAPGTAMKGFKGLPKVEDRADVIAYLTSLTN